LEDLLNFGNALLGYRLPSPESTELLLAEKVEVRKGSQYAYGFFDRTIGGQRVVGHGGGTPRVCTFMEMYLDSGYTNNGLFACPSRASTSSGVQTKNLPSSPSSSASWVL